MKKMMQSLFFFAALAILGAVFTNPAWAYPGQQCSIDGDCGWNEYCDGIECFPKCTYDSDCGGSDWVCRRDRCVFVDPQICELSTHSDLGMTTAIFYSDPGDYFSVAGNDRNFSSSHHCSGDSQCSTSYVSYALLNVTGCNTGVSCDVQPPGKAPGDENYPLDAFYHEHEVKGGKYRVLSQVGACSLNGLIYEVKPCTMC